MMRTSSELRAALQAGEDAAAVAQEAAFVARGLARGTPHAEVAGDAAVDVRFMGAVPHGTRVRGAMKAIDAAEAAERERTTLGPRGAQRTPRIVKYVADDTSDQTPPSTAATVAAGVAVGAAFGGFVGVLIGILADEPGAGAAVGAVIGGVTGGITGKG